MERWRSGKRDGGTLKPGFGLLVVMSLSGWWNQRLARKKNVPGINFPLRVMTLLGKDAEQYAGPFLLKDASVSGNLCFGELRILLAVD